jgi:hypothetical protein
MQKRRYNMREQCEEGRKQILSEIGGFNLQSAQKATRDSTWKERDVAISGRIPLIWREFSGL